jgi:hypothetical protein
VAWSCWYSSSTGLRRAIHAVQDQFGTRNVELLGTKMSCAPVAP